jgi:glycosyltransferase involved in cell wall biosynthesis
VAFIAGSLGPGGAEKQLVYMVRALQEKGAEVQVYCLPKGEYYEQALDAMGVRVSWVGQRKNWLIRIASIAAKMRRFRPHIVQSTHFFANPYACLPARFCGAMAIACSRSNLIFDVQQCKGWGRLILRMCPSLLVNSYGAKRNAELLSVKPERISVLENVIDLAAFDAAAYRRSVSYFGAPLPPVAAIVGRLIGLKRVDCFLSACAKARREAQDLKGLVIGDGPERSSLERQAESLGLLPGHVTFLGQRSDVPTLLGQATMLVHCSSHEGFPNAVLEAMAAGLPVITTPAGDAPIVVQDGISGYVVPFGDVDGMAARIVQLARSPNLSGQFGAASRKRVEQHYSYDGLGDRLLSAYRKICNQQNRHDLLRVLAS